MTVAQLIELLEKIQDKSKPVVVDLHENKSAWGTICEIWGYNLNYLTQDAIGNVRINASLPDNMNTQTRRNKRTN